ncbi:MAG TPA: xanthine dehydrogenase family protein molybdopterin-binding subunit, partial [Xanthobacteraceae bacterium]|nr:xanthine dehydrogenase family protein molybdopterin-binding subunit [Xanthobacteraceae bacterium]
MRNLDVKLTRRAFVAATSTLVIGAALPLRKSLAEPQPAGASLEPNAFVRIGSDDVVTVLSKHIEFGQGAHTGMATLV